MGSAQRKFLGNTLTRRDRSSAQELLVPATDKTIGRADQTVYPHPHVPAGPPISFDTIPPEQGRSDFPVRGSGCGPVMRLKGLGPPAGAPFRRKERSRQAAEPAKRHQPAKGQEFHLDVDQAGQLVVQPDRSPKQRPTNHLDADAPWTIGDEQFLAPVLGWPQQRGAGQLQQVDPIRMTRTARLGLDFENGRMECGPPVDGGHVRGICAD